ncbi:multiple epidermal growth factor-like domains protein 10 [Ostrea edulis]|uniref:multiple epidermal growth factor-like domains protein 10 n=1 Tax=Ostrea edulis TaxID=37623 RepID=UPI0024AFDA18|nr:multiple epidermal growth factor-like domains protein 10 [Ostrea edulis]
MFSELIVEIMLIQFVSRTTCFVNLAHTTAQTLQGNAAMNKSPFKSEWNAQRAVDGSTDQLYSDNSCAITSLYSEPLWWKVWLTRKFNIAYLEIYLRADTYKRSTGFHIYTYDDESFTPPYGVTGSLVYHHNPMSDCPDPIMNITVNRVARGVAFYNERPLGFSTSCPGVDASKTSLDICEVKVMGCDATRYHPGCTKACPTKCKDSHCDAFNGSCIYGCASPTAVTTNCTECAVNTYVSSGTCVRCVNCKGDIPCNRTNGRCDNGCDKQWIGDTCKLCRSGFYGDDCNQHCGKCKSGTVCHNYTGLCPQGCQENWNGTRCDVCRSGLYGGDCNQQCGKCKSATVCNNANGNCTQGCQGNWDGIRCDVCPVNHYVLNGDCIQCGHCRGDSPCNRTTGRCDDGCENQWLEDICKICRSGFYGGDCNQQCGNCKSGTVCHNVTGVCPQGCQGNWSGTRCDVCRPGFYGGDCDQRCGKCKSRTICKDDTGYCPQGCRDNWSGPRCDVCRPLFYGGDCDQRCGKCKSGTICKDDTGFCPQGCQDNWSGPRCDECIPYKYGPNCAFDCGHCKDGRPCSAGNGSCLNGCEEGWEDISCLKVLSKLDRQEFTNSDKSPVNGLYVAIGILSTLLIVTVTVLVYKFRKQRQQPSQRHDNNPPQNFVNHIEMEETHDYDKLGVRDTDEYQELPPIVADQPPQEKHASDSNYINSTLR